MTYSLVARDGETGELGAAVQTRAFAVGRVVPWVRPGVGAVATQAFSERSYGPLALELLAAGRSAEEALRGLVAADARAESRQVAVVDAAGRAAAHTGSLCLPETGHVVGDGFSAQANMMRSAEVWPAMAEAFGAARGTLAQRLLAALDAGEGAGGDFRGRRTAALVVVSGDASLPPWDGRVVDLRVDEHPEPLAELRRLLALEEAYRRLGASEGELDGQAVEQARAAGVPDDELDWFRVVAAWRAGEGAAAERLLRPLVERDARWAGALAALGSPPEREE